MRDVEQANYWNIKGENALSNLQVNPLNTAENNRKILEMPNIRVFYQKKGRAKYISHLDITRCMQRSLKRAKIPVWYTQGFNPHMYMTFALPLALGYESECEAMDLRLTQLVDFERMKTQLNQALPVDIQVVKIALQNHKPQEIAKASYAITFLPEDVTDFEQQFDEFCNQSEIVVIKKTKKGTKPMDVKPEFEILTKERLADRIVYHMVFTAGQKNINPTLLTDAFLQRYPDEVIVQILRKQIYLQDNQIFE